MAKVESVAQLRRDNEALVKLCEAQRRKIAKLQREVRRLKGSQLNGTD